ncbi:MAG: HNH endonuclease [Chloroflexi bacterium]|nr:HNH endonuclease [Chloroflexota bacterium]
MAPIDLLKRLPNYQGGPTRHRCAVCAYTLGVERGAANVGIDVEDRFGGNAGADEAGGAIEGAVSFRLHREYERDSRNRAKAILYHGTKCKGCGFFFDDTYTPQHANGYIEVHHVKPLAAGQQLVDPQQDLIPLCANCHRMVHRHRGESLSLDQLQRLLAVGRGGLSQTST